VLALRDLQTAFFRSLTTAPGPSAREHFDPALLRVVEGRGPLGPSARLDIYAQMYWARMHDVLLDDFPRVAATAGAERFGAVVRGYLVGWRSAHPSVRHVGEGFAAFLEQAPETEDLPFLADLARLEWARLAVFDAADAPSLRRDELQGVAPANWASLSFRLVPAVRLLRTAWPVQDLWMAAGEGNAPACPRPAETCLRIWRAGFMVYHGEMDVQERVALDCLVRGQPFEAMCAALGSMMGAEQAVREAARLLLRWIDDGILAGF